MTADTFAHYVEVSESEGESWHFWIQTRGNKAAIEFLGESLLGLFGEDDYAPYTLYTDILTEEQVDLLCEFADEGYMASHQKVTGVLKLPVTLTEADLYGGGILKLVTKSKAKK